MPPPIVRQLSQAVRRQGRPDARWCNRPMHSRFGSRDLQVVLQQRRPPCRHQDAFPASGENQPAVPVPCYDLSRQNSTRWIRRIFGGSHARVFRKASKPRRTRQCNRARPIAAPDQSNIGSTFVSRRWKEPTQGRYFLGSSSGGPARSFKSSIQEAR